MIPIFSSNVHVYSFRYLMNRVLDKLFESGDYVSSPRNAQHELAMLGCRGAIHAVRQGSPAPRPWTIPVHGL